MFMEFPSKGQEQIGKLWPETGVRTGKATPTSMDKASLLRLPPAMDATWCLTMLHPQVGPLDKPSMATNSLKHIT